MSWGMHRDNKIWNCREFWWRIRPFFSWSRNISEIHVGQKMLVLLFLVWFAKMDAASAQADRNLRSQEEVTFFLTCDFHMFPWMLEIAWKLSSFCLFPKKNTYMPIDRCCIRPERLHELHNWSWSCAILTPAAEGDRKLVEARDFRRFVFWNRAARVVSSPQVLLHIHVKRKNSVWWMTCCPLLPFYLSVELVFGIL